MRSIFTMVVVMGFTIVQRLADRAVNEEFGNSGPN